MEGPESYPISLSNLKNAVEAVCPIRHFSLVDSERVAIRTPKVDWSYRELDKRVAQASLSLARKGICKGNPVAVLATRTPETVVWLFGALRLGIPVFLMSERLPVAAINSACQMAKVEGLISDGFSTGPESSDLEVDVIPAGEYMTGLDSPASTVFDLECAATLLTTSGTEGTPKIAVHSLRNHLWSAAASADRIPFAQDDCWLLSLPLYHVGGLAILFRVFIAGGSVCVPAPRMGVHDVMKGQQITHLSLVETQLRRLLKAEPVSPGSVKTVLVGGGQVAPSLLRRAIRGGYPIRTTYGMTEFGSQMATSGIWKEERARYSCGKALSDIELTASEVGEIRARGPALFMGYLSQNGPARAVDGHGWFETGDLGQIDNEELVIFGRKDAMFISGGENIEPEEIEAALLELTEIRRATVVPVEDAEFGFRPVAVLEWKGERISTWEIERKLAEHVPKFKIPIAFLDWPAGDDLGRIKIDRRRLEEFARQQMKTKDEI